MEPLRATHKPTGRALVSYNQGTTWAEEGSEEAKQWAQSAAHPRGIRSNQRPIGANPEANRRQMTQEISEGLGDAAVAAGTGLTSGGDDELVGLLTPGADYETARAKYAERKALGRERSPGVSAASEAVGGLVQGAALPLGGIAKGLPVAKTALGAARVGKQPILPGALNASRVTLPAAAKQVVGQTAARQAIQGAAEGAAAGGLSAEPGSRGEGAVTGALTGGISGGVMGTLARGAARLRSGRTGKTARLRADEARVAAGGNRTAEVAQAPGGVARQAETQRRLGIGKRLLTSVDEAKDQAQAAARAAEQGRSDIRARVGQSVTQTDQLADRIAEEAAAQPVVNQKQARYLSSLADDFRRQPPQTFNQLDESAQALNRSAYAQGSEEALSKEAVLRIIRKEQEALAEKTLAGSGKKYSQLGVDEQGASTALEGLSRKQDESLLRYSPWAAGAAVGLVTKDPGLAAAGAAGTHAAYKGLKNYGPNLRAAGREAVAAGAELAGRGGEAAFTPTLLEGSKAAAAARRLAAANTPEEKAVVDYQESVLSPEYRAHKGHEDEQEQEQEEEEGR